MVHILSLIHIFGMMFFGQTIGFGYSILTGSLTLTLMVLPLLTRNTQEALKTVPDSYRHGAVGLLSLIHILCHLTGGSDIAPDR